MTILVARSPFNFAASAGPGLRLIKALPVAAALLTAGLGPVMGSELISQKAGFQGKLGAASVNITYVPTDIGYKVVVTTGTEEPGSVVRFVSILAPGQRAVVSVPREVGQSALELRLHRVGDRLELERSPAKQAANAAEVVRN